MDLSFDLPTDRILYGHSLIMRCRITMYMSPFNNVIRSLTIEIPFPDNYPDTDLSSSSEIFALGDLSLQTRNNNELFLTRLFVSPQAFSDLATDEEKDALKGMGKIMLKTAIEVALQYNFINVNGSISLEAASLKGSSACVDSFDVYNLTISEIINTYMNKFPRELEEYIKTNSNYLEDEIDDKLRLVEYICKYQYNYNLIEYYESLGFRIVGPSITLTTQMNAKIKDLHI